jgi:hypothetical protein
MAYDEVLESVAGVCAGCAILTLTGHRLLIKGNWKGSSEEEQTYANLVKEPEQATSTGLSYFGKTFVVTRPMEGGVIAQLDKEGIVVQKSDAGIIAAYWIEGHIPNQVTGAVAGAVRKL